MCGIAGIIGNFKTASVQKLIQKMLSVIQHRGPDSSGLWAKNGCAFGMTRLSIIDLPGGEQPIWTESDIGIVFNGEIYNYKTLREDLRNEGIKFKTNSDTEVILRLYEQKGIDAIHDLEGMFAICLYDPRIQKVYLVRDRIGVKPLYYHHGEQFVFASEIKSILEILPEKPPINQQSLWHYLTLRYVPSPDSIWNGIKKLEPAHYIEYSLESSTFKIHKYWDIDFNSHKKFPQTHDYEKEFETLFLEAVDKRLLASDVPVGVMLSGGLDSSSIAAAAIELGHKNFHTFSIGFEEGGNFNELKYAQEVAECVGSRHHEYVLTQKEFCSFLDDFVWYSDEPLADLASIPLYFVSKLAAQHVKVALSGEGADETLAGYNLDVTARRLFYLKHLNCLPSFLLELLPYQSLQNLGRYGYSDFLKSTGSYATNVFSEEEKTSFYRTQEKKSTLKYIQSLYEFSLSKEPIEQLQKAYTHSWLVEDLLMKADKMSMANSLELRVPFLDHKLVEWCARLPLEWKVGSFTKGFTTKRILREFAKKRLPERIINRSKQGFPVPAYEWLKQKGILSKLEQYLSEGPFYGLINRSATASYLKAAACGDTQAAHKVWNLVILAKWMKRWL